MRVSSYGGPNRRSSRVDDVGRRYHNVTFDFVAGFIAALRAAGAGLGAFHRPRVFARWSFLTFRTTRLTERWSLEIWENMP